MPVQNPGHLTDAQARSLVIRSLRNSRKALRAALTAGELLERELDRLVKRKTRINAQSFSTTARQYSDFNAKVDLVSTVLSDTYDAASQF